MRNGGTGATAVVGSRDGGIKATARKGDHTPACRQVGKYCRLPAPYCLPGTAGRPNASVLKLLRQRGGGEFHCGMRISECGVWRQIRNANLETRNSKLEITLKSEATKRKTAANGRTALTAEDDDEDDDEDDARRRQTAEDNGEF